MDTIKRLKLKIHIAKKALDAYFFDAKHFIENSLLSGYSQDEEHFLRMITLRAHVVEKGLTMPAMRPNFGEENILALIDLCKAYASMNYDTSHTLYVSAISVLFEYENTHIKLNKTIHPHISDGIATLKSIFPNLQITEQLDIERDQVFRHSDFKEIAYLRHSIRNFEGDIDRAKIYQAIALAQTAPSACNRQPVRVHVIPHGKIFDNILQLQRGNRGFGNAAAYLLVVVASEAGYNGINERHGMYVDGGIFIMNLLYALQYYSIASCTLNCFMMPEEEKLLQLELQTKDRAIGIIAIGGCPEKLKVARSQRVPAKDIIKMHD